MPKPKKHPAPSKQKQPPMSARVEHDPDRGDEAGLDQETRRALALLEPLLEFHKAVEEAAEDDVRIFWDIRIVRGQDQPFAGVAGSSTLPRFLAPKMIALAPGAIQQEISEKITIPLMTTFRSQMEMQTPEGLKERADQRPPDNGTVDDSAD
jgi:hypothetical protein